MTYRIVNTDNFGGDYPDEKLVEYQRYNEACALCGVPFELHRNEGSPPETSPNSSWGWLTCRRFTRCNPPRVLDSSRPIEFITKQAAQEQADKLNVGGNHAPRYYKVVEMPYELQPGFEP